MNLNQYWKQGALKGDGGLEKLCCGCSACEQVCPKQAISMKENKNGFSYPVIDDSLCVDCGLCVKKCQYLTDSNIIETRKEPKVYAVISENTEALKRSSSGGAAYVLGETVIENNGVVFGAVYSDEMEIVHRKIEKKEDLKYVQGSKYAQSKIKDSYKQAEECLKKGQKVLFTGTPCQIGGLYNFLGKDYEELYTMDIICYGVSSPGIFKEYIKWKENKTKGKIKSINFRSKIDRWGISVTEIEYRDRKKLVKYSDDDEWYKTFLSHIATREACHSCLYTNLQRKSDITVGDFWGIEKYKPDLNCEKGLSKVMINTEKGEKIFKQCKDGVWNEEMVLESAIRPNLQHPPKKNEKRDRFFEDYEKLGFYEAYKNNVENKTSFKTKVKRWIKIKIKSNPKR